MRGLYVIVDLTALEGAGLDPLSFADATLEARPAAVQLRAKHAPISRVLPLARELAVRAARAGVPFFVNDRVDVALACGAAVHLGQDDMPPHEAAALARRMGVQLDIGYSTHNLEQALAALEQPLRYLAVGPVFQTSSKERPDPVLGAEGALELLARVRAVRPELPVVAIGGLTLERSKLLSSRALRFDALAMISALIPSAGGIERVSLRARELAHEVAW